MPSQSAPLDSIAVSVERSAPRLWRRVPLELRGQVDHISRTLSTTQEFANSGFPEGTNHGLNHVVGILRRVDYLISHAAPSDFNELECYLLALAILLHDSGLYLGRAGHADASRILEVISSLELPIERSFRVPIARIAAAHSGFGRLEELPSQPTVMNAALNKASLRSVAAVLRISDEVAEDALRTSPAMLAAAAENSSAYHEISANSLCGFAFDDQQRSIFIQLTADEHKLSLLMGEGALRRTFLAWFIERCSKIEEERQYCNRFLPLSLRLDCVRLRILDNLSSDPWLDCILPHRSADLRAIVYGARPMLLFPSVNLQNKADFGVDCVSAVRECLGDNMKGILQVGQEHYIVLTAHSPSPITGDLLTSVVDQAKRRHHIRLNLEVLDLPDFYYYFALGDPSTLWAVHNGRCLLSSKAVAAAQNLLRQPLRFCRQDLLSMLVKRAALLLEKVETARSLVDQLDKSSQFVSCAAQVVGICYAFGKHIKANRLLRLGDATALSNGLSSMSIPNSLRNSFRHFVRLHRALAIGELESDAPPDATNLDLIYEWYSYMSAMVVSAKQKDECDD
jgi:hypothetical protein